MSLSQSGESRPLGDVAGVPVVPGDHLTREISHRPLTVAVVIPTYRRMRTLVSLIRTLGRIDAKDCALFLVVADDAPDEVSSAGIVRELSSTGLAYRYLPRDERLGQGTNLLHALRDVPDCDYVWTMGDDDFPIVSAAERFLEAVNQLRPTVAVCEFRQGADLSSGTFFGGEIRMRTDSPGFLRDVSAFGKLSNVMFRRPSPRTMGLADAHFRGCMYEDRAVAVIELLSAQAPSVLIFPELTVTGTSSFARLPYSMRVFVNLHRTIVNAAELSGLDMDAVLGALDPPRSEWAWWRVGLRVHFSSKTPVHYTPKVLRRELTFPLRRLIGSSRSRDRRFAS